MAVSENLAEALNNVELEYENGVITGVNDPYSYQKLTGMLSYLFGQQNTERSIIQTEMIREASNSKFKKLKLRYLPHDGENNVSETVNVCNAVAMNREEIEIIEPTLEVQAKFSIDEDIIQQGTLEDLQSRLTKEFANATRKLRERIDLNIFSAAATNAGTNPAKNAAAGTYTSLELLKADGTVSSDVFDTIKNDHEDNFMVGDMGVVGLGNMRKYINRLAVGADNDGGVQVGEIMSEFGQMLYKDQQTTAALGGANRVLAFTPGLQSFYNYSFYLGQDFRFNTTGFRATSTITDPVYPIVYDYVAKYDDGCGSGGSGKTGVWTFTVFTHYDLWTVNPDAFGDVYGDLAGFNGIVGYDITQAS